MLDNHPYSVNNEDPMTASGFKSIRKALQLRQDELGKRLGISRVSVTRYENGTVRIPKSRAIALENLMKLEESAA